MASVKISDLQALTTPSSRDVFLVQDVDTGTSRKVSFSDLKYASTTDELGDYNYYQNQRLQEGLATGYLYVQSLTIGG